MARPPPRKSRSTNSVIAKRSRPSLFTLPQELQDLIFDFAYPPATSEYIRLSKWTSREAARWRTNGKGYIKQPCPPLLVESLLVSRAFFAAAAKAWAGNQDFRNGIDFASIRYEGPVGIVAAHAKIASIDPGDVYYITRAIGLRSLTVSIREYLFHCIEDEVLVWEDKLSEAQLECVRQNYHCLECLMGLGEGISMRFRGRPSMWDFNVARLEAHLRNRKVLSPEPAQENEPDRACRAQETPQAPPVPPSIHLETPGVGRVQVLGKRPAGPDRRRGCAPAANTRQSAGSNDTRPKAAKIARVKDVPRRSVVVTEASTGDQHLAEETVETSSTLLPKNSTPACSAASYQFGLDAELFKEYAKKWRQSVQLLSSGHHTRLSCHLPENLVLGERPRRTNERRRVPGCNGRERTKRVRVRVPYLTATPETRCKPTSPSATRHATQPYLASKLSNGSEKVLPVLHESGETTVMPEPGTAGSLVGWSTSTRNFGVRTSKAKQDDTVASGLSPDDASTPEHTGIVELDECISYPPQLAVGIESVDMSSPQQQSSSEPSEKIAEDLRLSLDRRFTISLAASAASRARLADLCESTTSKGSSKEKLIGLPSLGMAPTLHGMLETVEGSRAVLLSQAREMARGRRQRRIRFSDTKC
ncbi:hypothetical protein LTR53_014816 [Teratosphaeriaceae sp. CCFEE 6253]|nr:hypothetical protein LTR53_014816 [Teratosphaeriaceae sp. CCFEE 6253]